MRPIIARITGLDVKNSALELQIKQHVTVKVVLGEME
jgi:hypothetical protein